MSKLIRGIIFNLSDQGSHDTNATITTLVSPRRIVIAMTDQENINLISKYGQENKFSITSDLLDINSFFPL